MDHFTLISAFLAGLLGSVHCIGMCGGIVGVLVMGLPEPTRRSLPLLLPYIAIYNIGRIASYIVAGLLVGFLGAQFTKLLPMDNPHVVAMWVSGLFMIALGLYLGAWWQALVILEKTGAHLWHKIEPFGRRFLPVTHLYQALGLGIVWGWLPCGLVYSVLAFALASGSAVRGSLLMLAFGIGTLPMLLLMGSTARWFTRFAGQLVVRRIAGATVIVFGLFILFGPHHSMQHQHDASTMSHEVNTSMEKMHDMPMHHHE